MASDLRMSAERGGSVLAQSCRSARASLGLSVTAEVLEIRQVPLEIDDSGRQG